MRSIGDLGLILGKGYRLIVLGGYGRTDPLLNKPFYPNAYKFDIRFAPSTADPSLFLRTDTTLPLFYMLVYVDDLVFATSDTEALAHVKSELQKRHMCTVLGPSALWLHVLLTIVHSSAYRTKHIALRYFLARELQQRGQLRLAYVATQANTADIFTKALQPCDHQRFCSMLACFAFLDRSCDLMFSPTLPMGEKNFMLGSKPIAGFTGASVDFAAGPWVVPPSVCSPETGGGVGVVPGDPVDKLLSFCVAITEIHST
ncbi:unnamed protein product [Closterium sp. NIES-53]